MWAYTQYGSLPFRRKTESNPVQPDELGASGESPVNVVFSINCHELRGLSYPSILANLHAHFSAWISLKIESSKYYYLLERQGTGLMSQQTRSKAGSRNAAAASAKVAVAPKDIVLTLGLYSLLIAGGLWASLNALRWFWSHLL